jgi:hypothetical protein
MPLDSHRRRKHRRTLSTKEREIAAVAAFVIILSQHLITTYAAARASRNAIDLEHACKLIHLMENSRSLSRCSREPGFKSVDWWVNVVPRMSSRRFRRNFRVSRDVARQVVDGLNTYPSFVVSKYAPRTKAKSLELKVAITLWRLGSTRTECDAEERFGVSSGFVHDACEAVLTAIVHTFGDLISNLIPITDSEREAAALAGHPCFKALFRCAR